MTPEQTIRAARKERGLSQRRMAEMVHIGQRTYARYESGQRDMPDAIVELLCIKLGMDYPSIARDHTTQETTP